MDEEDPLCVGICQADPETGCCIGCGRQYIHFGPAEARPPSPGTDKPEVPEAPPPGLP